MLLTVMPPPAAAAVEPLRSTRQSLLWPPVQQAGLPAEQAADPENACALVCVDRPCSVAWNGCLQRGRAHAQSAQIATASLLRRYAAVANVAILEAG